MRPLGLVAQSTGSLAELSFSSEEEEEDDLLFDDPNVVDLPSTPPNDQHMDAPPRRLPPDSPQLLSYILLWVVAVGSMIIAQVIPHLSIRNQVAHNQYVAAQADWTTHGQPVMNATWVAGASQQSMAGAVNFTHIQRPHPRPTSNYMDDLFAGVQSFTAAFEGPTTGTLYIMATHPNATTRLSLPLTLLRSVPLQNIASENDCTHTGAKWKDGTCIQRQSLTRACALLTLDGNKWVWASLPNRTDAGCLPGQEGVEMEYGGIQGSKGGPLEVTPQILLRHPLDPHLLALTLPFNLTEEEKANVSQSTQTLSIAVFGLSGAATLLIGVTRYLKARAQ
eukprot:comp12352_c0_seq1/m.7214 comp12352_c0_seq1/g.7214  ORF comp12352_c0_seq1/g.7214 comp12352_c0_seq1/m.7214 type:complete len:336 (-) comp12352_c0_seq1:166-1173(-)